MAALSFCKPIVEWVAENLAKLKLYWFSSEVAVGSALESVGVSSSYVGSIAKYLLWVRCLIR
jgi:hypothetical protein